jgi:hypothetical protein
MINQGIGWVSIGFKGSKLIIMAGTIRIFVFRLILGDVFAGNGSGLMEIGATVGAIHKLFKFSRGILM